MDGPQIQTVLPECQAGDQSWSITKSLFVHHISKWMSEMRDACRCKGPILGKFHFLFQDSPHLILLVLKIFYKIMVLEKYYNHQTVSCTHLPDLMLVKSGLKAGMLGFSITWTKNFQIVQAGFTNGRGTKDQIANICWITEKAREFQKNTYLCFIDYANAFDCVHHINCGKFLKRWEYHSILPVSWETCMQVKKQQ